MDLDLTKRRSDEERPSITQKLTDLVCPVCYEYMQPPIMLCEQGHSICSLCHELMSECPLCQGKLTFRRSSALEALTAVITFPCKHCNKKYRLEDLETHKCFENIEDHSPNATCIVGQVYGDCFWNGPSVEMPMHCSKNHPEQYWTDEEITTEWTCSDIFNLGVQNLFIVELKNAMFVVVQKFDSNKKTLSWNFSCECSDHQLYDYEIRIISGNQDVVIQRTQVENAFNIMSFFPSSNEISVNVDKITKYLNDNILKYKIAIVKRNNVKDEIRLDLEPNQFVNKLPDEELEEKVEINCWRKAFGSIINFYTSVKRLLRISN